MRVKPLIWQQKAFLLADSPAPRDGYFAIVEQDGLWYPSWDLSMPGSHDVEALKKHAQDFHNAYIMQFLENVA